MENRAIQSDIKCRVKDRTLYRAFIHGVENLLSENDLLIKEQTVIELMEGVFLVACENAPQKEMTKTKAGIERIKRLLNT